MWMGVKHINRCCGIGKVNSALTAQHINEHNHKCTTSDDLYGAGEQSGKHAKPDACSAAANVWAHTQVAEEWATKAEPPSVSFPLPASLPCPACTHPLHIPCPLCFPFPSCMGCTPISVHPLYIILIFWLILVTFSLVMYIRNNII